MAEPPGGPDAGLRARGVTSSVSVTERRRFPSYISDARRALIEPVLQDWQRERLARNPVPVQPKHSLREIWNALLYLNRTGVQWQYLPHDLPHYQSVNSYYTAWRDEGVFERLNMDMTRLARAKASRAPEPTAAIADTQSVKTSGNVPAADQGTDAGKKIVGRKRGIVTGTPGLLLAVTVMAASVTENAAGMRLLSQAKDTHPQITHARADSGLKNQAVEHAAAGHHPRDRAAPPRRPGVPRCQGPPGRRADHRLADDAQAAGPGLRKTPPIIPGHDPPGHDRQHH